MIAGIYHRHFRHRCFSIHEKREPPFAVNGGRIRHQTSHWYAVGSEIQRFRVTLNLQKRTADHGSISTRPH
jgi:hypothetical protein